MVAVTEPTMHYWDSPLSSLSSSRASSPRGFDAIQISSGPGQDSDTSQTCVSDGAPPLHADDARVPASISFKSVEYSLSKTIPRYEHHTGSISPRPLKRPKIESPPDLLATHLTPEYGEDPVPTEHSYAGPQLKTCIQLQLPSTRRCVSCRARKGGDICRFNGIRNLDREGPESFANMATESQTLCFRERWNTELTKEHRSQTRDAVVPTLLEMLLLEKKHLDFPLAIYRHHETEVRATCDVCSTSLFNLTWFCCQCGRELCEDCIRGLSNGDANNQPPRLSTCHLRYSHAAPDFMPVSRFHPDQLHDAILAMKNLPIASNLSSDSKNELPSSQRRARKQLGYECNWSISPSCEPQHLDIEDLTEARFKAIWDCHLPFVVSGLLPRFKKEWTPSYLRETYGSQVCQVVNCQTNAVKTMKVNDFFSLYGRNHHIPWKLKDWPPTEDFESAFPDLFADFHEAVPAPKYTRRDGVLNLFSHFPSNTIAPDVGPKMYNALATPDIVGTRGTTRLHMDMADAVNIMLHAERCSDNEEGYAIWDLFSPAATIRIREFLLSRFPPADSNHILDPIHAQQHYLDRQMLQELSCEKGVHSFRVYQRPGEAVFIPAGCAHQVLNRADCIKVAIDFVSPENIRYCQKLTREFREQNFERCWKDDVLQLKSMMWFAWLSCSRYADDTV